jgi:ATP synthase protein I
MKQEYRALGNYGTLGIEIVLCLAFGFFGGRWLDGRFHTEPWLAALGFFFGAGAAVKAIVRTWKEMQKITAEEERIQGNPAPMFDDRPPKRDEGTDERA